MRETRLYGSEGGEAKAFPTPIGDFYAFITNSRLNKMKIPIQLKYCTPETFIMSTDYPSNAINAQSLSELSWSHCPADSS